MNYSELTFNDDKLDRKNFIINIMNIIESWDNTISNSESLVIAINSNWGSGKSYLMNMWRNWLTKQNDLNSNYAVTSFNAWEDDDYDNPFIPLTYSLRKIEICGDVDLNKKNIVESSKKFFKSCGIAIVKDGLKKFIGEETSKIISEGLDSINEVKIESFFRNYEEYLNQKKLFEKELDMLIPYNGKLIVMIDELDRCRPVYSVETLEIIKHFFNRKDIVFVIALDIEQLSHSVSTLYGNNMDSNGYLRRFFDVTLNIPQGDIYKFVRIKYEEILSNLYISTAGIERICDQYINLQLSLRDVEKITNNLIIFCMYYKNEIARSSYCNDVVEFYTYFIVLKHKYPDIYKRVLRVGFMSYNNQPENYPYLDKFYYSSDYISTALHEFQNGNLQNRTNNLNDKYGMASINNRYCSLAENIERALEMLI